MPRDSVAQTRLTVTVKWVGLVSTSQIPPEQGNSQATSVNAQISWAGIIAHDGKVELQSLLRSREYLASVLGWGDTAYLISYPALLLVSSCAAEQSALKPDLASNHAIIKTIL